MGGPAGTAVGAAIGGGLGLLTSGAQVFEERDDAFKSYVQESYEGQLSDQETSLTSGSTIAGSREQTQMAFAQRLGGDEAAAAYLRQLRQQIRQNGYIMSLG